MKAAPARGPFVEVTYTADQAAAARRGFADIFGGIERQLATVAVVLPAHSERGHQAIAAARQGLAFLQQSVDLMMATAEAEARRCGR